VTAQLNRLRKHLQNLAEGSQRASQPKEGLESGSQEICEIRVIRGNLGIRT
jgi:hypothetical protein